MILKLDPNEIQGIPDLLILYNEHWAVLEVKRAANSSHRPNQDYYVAMLNEWSYSSFVHPDNEEEVLNGLEQTFRANR